MEWLNDNWIEIVADVVCIRDAERIEEYESYADDS